MTDTEHTAPHRGLPSQTYVRIALSAAAAAEAADEDATHKASRSSTRNEARLTEVMLAVHEHAVAAGRWARYADTWESDGVSRATLANYAARAVEAAALAETTAGVPGTADTLRAALQRPLTAEERAERERAARRREAQERAATGMDRANRVQAEFNRLLAREHVGKLGWTAGHVRVLEAAETGRLYWRDRQARIAPRGGIAEGGRRVSRERTRLLYASRFLTASRARDGVRFLRLSPMGEVALELVRLHPDGLCADDRAAYESRYAAAARSWMSSDEKKEAARRLPPLARHAVRRFRRPVTLAAQERRLEEVDEARWEGEGGACPAVQPPRPAPSAAGPRGHSAGAAPASSPATTQERVTPTPSRPGPVPVLRRPQRTLTADEAAQIGRFKRSSLLNFYGAKHMGILDPVRNPSPMSEDEGAQVRETVWPKHLQVLEDRYVWGFFWSMCERGTCWNCLSGDCGGCLHRNKGGPHACDNTEIVYWPNGQRAADLILRPGGEECVWWCRCPCLKFGAPPGAPAAQKAAPEKEEAAAAEAAPEPAGTAEQRPQLSLF
ncbi:DUF6248 family natural product biosynthesis protein (plasmid) [Streptomyces sp. SDT5-1]|uniref:DUF6248 family natural product biosynthesis protein n=1 Tax=Streptomyces sp. SDT5-1 TaxID=3406418 RepID=UPI003FD0A2B4